MNNEQITLMIPLIVVKTDYWLHTLQYGQDFFMNSFLTQMKDDEDRSLCGDMPLIFNLIFSLFKTNDY